MNRKELEADVVEQLEATRDALQDVGSGPRPLPARQTIAVTVDCEGLRMFLQALDARIAYGREDDPGLVDTVAREALHALKVSLAWRKPSVAALVAADAARLRPTRHARGGRP